jgi:predicted transcriptional regulator of viral defense system
MFSKNITYLQQLNNLPYFTIQEAADIFGINIKSASVLCSRYAKRGLLVRLKNNLYITLQRFEGISKKELCNIANRLQVPSYISLMTAMDYYEITTQMQGNFIESISLKRTIEYEPSGVMFKYYRLQKKYYFDFEKINGLFIASKEKAFIDAVYLYSFGKYNLDKSSLDLNKLNKIKIKKLIKAYPEKTKNIVRKLCRI